MLGDQRAATRSGEASLLQRVTRREDAAVVELYENHADNVFRFVYRRVDRRFEDAQEITQDTFVSAVSLASTYDGSCVVFTWLCGIAKLRIVDFYRRQGRDKRIPPSQAVALEEETIRALRDCEANEDAVDAVLDRIEAKRLVQRMLDTLADDEREALMLRYVEELPVREIASLMHRSEKAVENLLARARTKAAHAAARWLEK